MCLKFLVLKVDVLVVVVDIVVVMVVLSEVVVIVVHDLTQREGDSKPK